LEVTISLEPARAMGGSLVPGDTVAVLSSFDPGGTVQPTTGVLLHKVLVTQVQIDKRTTDTGFGSTKESKTVSTGLGQTTAPEGNLLITLALTAGSIERVVFTAENGSLWLAAEPPEAPTTGTQVQTYASVFGR
jgi:pilus assembly protein CpaB